MPDSTLVDPSSSHSLSQSIPESIANDRATVLETDVDRGTKNSPEEVPMSLDDYSASLSWAGSPARQVGHIAHLPTPQR
jgi:hypothetical protein